MSTPFHQGITPPRTLRGGRYALGEILGQGGTALVVRARDTELCVDRAVKLLTTPDPETRSSLQRRLASEARTMARLRHPHVLTVHDIGREGPLDYIVMDLAEGGSLSDRIERDGYLPLGEAVHKTVEVLSALAVAHDAGIVHRDIKPHNMLLGADGEVLLADFGIALVGDGDRRTRAGVAMGSFAYMPHEQRIDAAAVGPTADIYAVGASLYHMVTGQSPVDLFLYSDQPQHERWSLLPPILRPIVCRATAARPGDRYPDARAMAAELTALLEGGEIEVETRPVPRRVIRTPTVEQLHERTLPMDLSSRTGRERRRRATLLGVLAALVPAVGVLAAIVWWPGGSPGHATAFGPEGAASERIAPEPAPDEIAPVGVAPGRAAPERVSIEEIAPEIAPEPAVGAPPRPAPRPAPRQAEIPFGRWSGSNNGVRFRLELSGRADRVTGVASSALVGADRREEHAVRGTYDPVRRKLVLEEEGGVRYAFDVGEGRLEGDVYTDAFRHRLSLVWEEP